jgi:hypothetical protein
MKRAVVVAVMRNHPQEVVHVQENHQNIAIVTETETMTVIVIETVIGIVIVVITVRVETPVERNHHVGIEVIPETQETKEDQKIEEEEVIQKVHLDVDQVAAVVTNILLPLPPIPIEEGVQEVEILPHRSRRLHEEDPLVHLLYRQFLLGKSFVKRKSKLKRIKSQISFGMVFNGLKGQQL